jgi:signal peptidase II
LFLAGKSRAFWAPVLAVFLTDCTTKQLAAERLAPEHVPHDVIGEVVRFTLAYNRDAAFSISVGESTRWIFAALAAVVLVVLLRMYRDTPRDDRVQAAALALITGGALGNMIDRVRSPRGVVDFIDIGWGDVRFYTFNVADLGVTCGAVLLAILMLRRDRERLVASRVEASPPHPDRSSPP